MLSWAFIWLLLILFDIPHKCQIYFFPEFIKSLNAAPDFFQKYIFVLKYTCLNFIYGVLIAIILGALVIVFAIDLGIIIGSVFVVLTSVVYGISYDVIIETDTILGSEGTIAYGAVASFFSGIGTNIMVGISYRSVGHGRIALGLGTIIGVGYVVEYGFIVGIVIASIFCVSYLANMISPLYHIISSYQYPLKETTRLIANRGRFWLVGSKRQTFLEQNAQQSLEWSLAFCDFLFDYRRKLWPLAARLLHKAYAAEWQREPLSADVLNYPKLPKRLKRYLMDPIFKENIKFLKQDLIQIGQDQNDIRRLSGYKKALQELNQMSITAKIMRVGTRFSSKQWVEDYLKAITIWTNACQDKISELEQDIFNRLPYGDDPFVIAKPLSPENGREVFRGRKNVSDQLSRRITGTRELPMLLIQGQRRVGKTSLISFLETLLDRRFVVVKQDMQQGGLNSIEEWMQDLRLKVNRVLQHDEESVWQFSGNWGKDWAELGAHIQKVAEAQELRVILAIDEYERLHFLLRLRSENEALDLLGAIRSFTQHQNRVILLFAGLLDFNDLKAPDWTGIFVQRERIRVDYLSTADAKDLIEHPVPNFPITYTPEVVDEIVHLTQGQPALLQEIGSYLFNQASQQQEPHITMSSLQECIRREILVRGNQVMEVFWTGFCADPRYKKAVHEIINTGQCADRPVVLRLEDYGFIVKQAGGGYKMRVPLFEEWVKEFADFYED